MILWEIVLELARRRRRRRAAEYREFFGLEAADD